MQDLLDTHRPLSMGDLCATLERAGARDPFEADGLIIYLHAGRFCTVAATPGDVLAAARSMERPQ